MAKRMWLTPRRNHIFEVSQIPAFIAILPIDLIAPDTSRLPGYPRGVGSESA